MNEDRTQKENLWDKTQNAKATLRWFESNMEEQDRKLTKFYAFGLYILGFFSGMTFILLVIL